MLSQFFHGKYDLKGFRYCYEYSDISQNKLDLSQKINSLGGTINISPQDATVILIDKESNLRKKISKEISEDYEIVLYRSQSKPIKIELIEHFNRKSNSFELPNEATSDQLLNNLQSKKLKRYMYIEALKEQISSMTKSSVSFHKAFNRLKDQCDGDSLISVIVNNRQKFFIFDRLPSSELDYFKYFSKNVSRFISSFMTEEDFNSFRKGARSVKLGSKSTQGDQEPSVIMHYPHEREGKGKYCSLCNSVYSNYKQHVEDVNHLTQVDSNADVYSRLEKYFKSMNQGPKESKLDQGLTAGRSSTVFPAKEDYTMLKRKRKSFELVQDAQRLKALELYYRQMREKYCQNKDRYIASYCKITQ